MALAQLALRDSLRKIEMYLATQNWRLVARGEAVERKTFLTNNTRLGLTIFAERSQSRWQVEFSFRWIKRHLRVKAFFSSRECVGKAQS
jgi:IS4 transposase